MSTNDDVQTAIHISNSEKATIIISVVSMVFSLSVVYILILRYHDLVKGKTLVFHVLMIAISDSFVSLAFALGFHSEPSILCSFQGFIGETFEKLSWLWSMSLSVNIYCIVILRFILPLHYTNLIIWLIVIVLTFIPFFIGVDYGYSGGDTRCTFNVIHPDASDVVSEIQGGLAIFSLLVNLIVAIRLSFFAFFSKNELSETLLGNYMQTMSKDALETNILYIVGFIITWLPSQLYNQIVPSVSNTREVIITNDTHIVAPLYGLLLSLIFYFKTKDARRAWKEILGIIVNSDSNAIVNNIEAFRGGSANRIGD